MRNSSVVLGVMLAVMVAGSAAAEQRRAPEAEPATVETSAPDCGLFVIWTAIHFDERPVVQPIDGYGSLGAGETRWQPMQFWSGPFATAADAQTATVTIAIQGSWGSRLIGGVRNTGYVHEFFPPSRIVGTQYESVCPSSR